MRFWLDNPRYATDECGIVYDMLLEHVIDALCGVSTPSDTQMIPFLLNSAVREYLGGFLGSRTALPIIPCTYDPYVGFVVTRPNGFMCSAWLSSVTMSNQSIIEACTVDGMLCVSTGHLDSDDYFKATDSSGPVPPLANDPGNDSTCVFALLLLCRSMSSRLLTARYKNSHVERLHGTHTP